MCCLWLQHDSTFCNHFPPVRQSQDSGEVRSFKRFVCRFETPGAGKILHLEPMTRIMDSWPASGTRIVLDEHSSVPEVPCEFLPSCSWPAHRCAKRKRKNRLSPSSRSPWGSPHCGNPTMSTSVLKARF